MSVTTRTDYSGKAAGLSFFLTPNNLNKNGILQRISTQQTAVHLLSAHLKKQLSTLPAVFDATDKLLQSRQTVTNDSFFDVVYEFIMETYDFYKDRVLEAGTYHDIFAKQSATEQKYESVSALLSIVVSTVASEVKDSKTRENIIKRVQQQVSELKMIALAEPTAFSSAQAISRLGIYASPISTMSASVVPDDVEQNKPQ